MVERRTSFLTGMLLTAVLALGAGIGVSADSYVYDAAELFSTGETQQIQSLAEEIDEEYQMNVLVLTTEYAGGQSSSGLMEEAYEELGYDDNDDKGGIALIIDLDNGELNLVTDRDMIYYITDEREETIYDAGYEWAQDGEYGESMIAMLESVQEMLQKGIPGNQYTYDTETGRIVRHLSVTMSDLLIALCASLIGAGVICSVIYRSYTHVQEYQYQPERNANMKLTSQQDRLVNQFVTQRRIQQGPPPGAGGGPGGPDMGGGGRSSVHHSSGGHSYGGGHGRKL